MEHTFKILTKEEIIANRSSAYKFVSMETKDLLVDKIRTLHESIDKRKEELNKAKEALRLESPFKIEEKVLYGKDVCYVSHIGFYIEEDSFYFVYNLNKMKKDGSMSKVIQEYYIREDELKHFKDE